MTQITMSYCKNALAGVKFKVILVFLKSMTQSLDTFKAPEAERKNAQGYLINSR